MAASAGWPAPLSLTPRQLLAIAEYDGRRRAREVAATITASRLAHHGDKQAVSKALKSLEV